MSGVADDHLEAEFLGATCAHLSEIREVAAGAGLLATADRIITGLREQTEVTTLCAELTEVLRRSGVSGGPGTRNRGAGVGGLPPLHGHPVEEALVCPRLRCDRVVLLRDPHADRDCALHREPLRPVRIPT
ncbi:hypothetical protein [Streptacidiphilus sp. P02-A3a]|uniref:hypothetical protein n=1 Tax=Streptacidiphilus sp. P02-A3a TaxID=2704468 RepID=UPI0015F8A5CB|nr:hypothetical protein [Streptacidiphilus sp. P02-A3a]QMU69607.1 hypothetical protein GXP74_16535 [Streptacidiphilus sp. P02-A3a]